MVHFVWILDAFSHNGGQGCVLQGSSSGTGLAAESHFLSGTSSSVWRSTQRMTLNWEPTGSQRRDERMTACTYTYQPEEGDIIACSRRERLHASN